jgi:hypothetical protein
MASIDDVFGEIHSVNLNLNVVQNELSDIKAGLNLIQTTDQQGLALISSTLNAGFVNLSQGISALIQFQVFISKTLAHQSKQNGTMICILEHISSNTCAILDETHQQTGLQTKISEDVKDLAQMYRSSNPRAALELARKESLELKIRECCPPEAGPSPCVYESCSLPDDTQPPVPDVSYQPYQPNTPAPLK